MCKALAADEHTAPALAALLAGEPVIFPTDTVYGIGVAVGKAPTPEVLCDLKGRDHGKPIAWLVGCPDDLARYAKRVPPFAPALAQAFWPGPVTLVVEAAPSVPVAYRAPDRSIALRMPDNETARGLIRQLGAPIAATSANSAGQAPPRAFDEIDEALLGKVPVALRDDAEKSGVASTVVDCRGEAPVVLREGGVSAADIGQAVSKGLP
ncbi:MAG: L-threonylcarbamoyladenylate synthase [Eggerthellaceae bacterium]|jgi:L-threonylcarbamoyladenylate synthase|nr:L-threonylcarbamoyladenylate synthase [Eggerthellaceae bacterium]MDR2715256.1 threonylcarbamoyl-AMP synthase [Coriobacteriaceae bacterium]